MVENQKKRNNDMVIYKTTNLINGKIYVGKDALNRPSYLGSGFIFRRAISKYGRENFVKEIVEKCSTPEELNGREKHWIEFFRATDKNIGYNIMEGGHGGNCHNYRYGSDHPYFGKHRPTNIGVAVAKSNRQRPKVYGSANKSYKNIPPNVKDIILQLSQTMGRDKIYQSIIDMGLKPPARRTITRRLKEWKNEYAAS